MKSKAKPLTKKERKPFTKKSRRIYDLEQNLRGIIHSLETISRLTPMETSRYGCLMDSKTQGEEMAIIEARKSKLLSYIQLICQDHLIWSKKLMKDRM